MKRRNTVTDYADRFVHGRETQFLGKLRQEVTDKRDTLWKLGLNGQDSDKELVWVLKQITKVIDKNKQASTLLARYLAIRNMLPTEVQLSPLLKDPYKKKEP